MPTPRLLARFAAFALAFATLLLVVGAPAVAAQGESETTARGTLRGDVGGSREPLSGVTITITQGGGPIGTAITADDGSWEIDLPGGGAYDVEIDASTLPEGLAEPADDATTTSFDAVEGRRNGVVLSLTTDETRGSGFSRVERLATLSAQGLKLGLVIALAALGLSLIFGVTGLINFAHGELVTIGALAAWYLHVDNGLPLVLAGIITFVLGGGFGWLNERGLWSPLRQRGTGRIALIVVSIGLSIVLRYGYLMVFGGAARGYVDFTGQVAIDVGPVSMPTKDFAIIGIAAVVLLLVSVALSRTRLGMAARAVADNRDLAESSGIDVKRVILVVWVVGAALAALSGVLQGTTESVRWNMGFELILLTFAAVILGGIGTAYGAMVGGVAIGMAIQVSTYWITPELKVAMALLLLIGVLLVRPQGILGLRERVG